MLISLQVSCSTAQAVLELNREDEGNRRFIMVQLPEPTPEESIAMNAGYKTIQILVRVVFEGFLTKMKNDDLLHEFEDLGVKVFKLTESNYPAMEWN